MERRDFIRYSMVGASSLLCSGMFTSHAIAATSHEISLTIRPATVELIDGETVFMLFYFASDADGGFAAPTLRVTQGDQLTVHVTNGASEPHGFSIPGAAGATIPSIAPGETLSATFTIPNGGSYFYLDPVNHPVFQVLGLHGVMVVAPAEPTTPAGVITPYSRDRQTLGANAVFESLGTNSPQMPDKFPGDPWIAEFGNPAPKHERIWVFNSIDPKFNLMAELGQPIDSTEFVETNLPRYFTLNGLSGFDASFDERTIPKGFEGEPSLLRVLNAGLPTFSPHIHGNHIFELSTTNATGEVVVNENVIERDTWTMAPGDRKDVLLPFDRPSDIPDAAWPPFEEPFPLKYPMHCHQEISQTAGGGNYPQGLITDWELEGPLSARS